MSFFDELGRKITDAGKAASEKAKDLAEVTHLNSVIKEKQAQADALTAELGEAYFNAHVNDKNCEFYDKVDEIDNLKKAIDDCRSSILEIKGLVECPFCGTQFDADENCCPNCGKAIPRRAQSIVSGNGEEKLICAVCGYHMRPGSNFCIMCGTPVKKEDSAKTEESAVRVFTPAEKKPAASTPLAEERPVNVPTGVSHAASSPVNTPESVPFAAAAPINKAASVPPAAASPVNAAASVPPVAASPVNAAASVPPVAASPVNAAASVPPVAASPVNAAASVPPVAASPVNAAAAPENVPSADFSSIDTQKTENHTVFFENSAPDTPADRGNPLKTESSVPGAQSDISESDELDAIAAKAAAEISRMTAEKIAARQKTGAVPFSNSAPEEELPDFDAIDDGLIVEEQFISDNNTDGGSPRAAVSRPSINGCRCKKCGAPMAANAVFCPKCGAQNKKEHTSAPVCPCCGAFVGTGMTFCPECGSKLTQ